MVASTLIEVLRGTLPWAGLHASIFFASRWLAPLLFDSVRKLDSAGRSYWASSMCSLVNGFVLTPMAWFACCQSGLLALDASFFTTTPLSHMCCHAIAGYTMWDFIPLVYHRNEAPFKGGVSAYILHHVATIFSWSACSYSGTLHNVAVPVCLFEGTAPFVNGRYFLSTHGYKDTKLYMVNGVMMFLSFFFLRVLFNWGLFINRFILQRAAFATIPTYIQVMFVCNFPINLALQQFWFYKIVKGILALLFPKPKAGKKAD